MEEQSKLSDRELEILELIVEGASNKEIAARLVISTNTVKVHLRNIYAKLGVNSRTEAALLAIQSDLIRVESIAWKPSEVSMGHAESRSGLVPTLIVVGALLLTILGMLLWIRNSNDFPGTPGDGITIQEGMRWERKADLPTARSGLALTTVLAWTAAGSSVNLRRIASPLIFMT